jgi:hypothetical protein
MPHGIFVDLRSHWLARLGSATVSFARQQGGVLTIGRDTGSVPPVPAGGSAPAHLLRLGARMRLVCRSDPGSADYDQSVLVRQENDPAPKFHFLEEGPVRLGMRVAFDLLDDEGHYLGDGRQDVWLYAEGDVHVTWALNTIDLAGHGGVEDAWVETTGAAGYNRVAIGDQIMDPTGAQARRPFGDELPSKRLVCTGENVPAMGLYWSRDSGDILKMGYDHGALPPFYASRWPTGMQQWARGTMGWGHDSSAAVTATLGDSGPDMRFSWREGTASMRDVTHAATLVVSLAEDEQELARRIDAVQQPLTPEVSGGDFRCYTDEDGTYEIGQADAATARVTFPADALERTVRLRHYRRKTDPRHRGAVVATVDGERTAAQLMSEGELTDDICVVMEMSHRNDSVDDVIISARLKTDAPTVIELRKVPGIQATYQSEISGVDLQRRAGNHRDVAVWSSRNKDRPLLELDLFSGAVHRWTNYGPQTEPVLWEMPMAWFLSCGISRHHYLNQNDTFEILDNGPERVQLHFSGTNPNRRARSHTWLTIPGDHPRPRIEVRMRLEVLEQWDGDNVEFSDIFPYPSRLVETWFHDAVLFMQGDGSSLIHTLRPDRSHHRPPTGDPGPRLFYGLFSSDRGNVLALMENDQHPQVPFHYSVCGNYIDVHVNLHAPQAPIPAGSVFEISYAAEMYGDGDTSVDEIHEIGRRSLELGEITV